MNLVKLIKDGLPFSLGAKLLFGALLGLVVGNQGFNLCLTSAIYYDSLAKGIRVPAEGLDILSPTVQFVSFTFTFLAGIIIIVLVFILYLFQKLQFKFMMPISDSEKKVTYPVQVFSFAYFFLIIYILISSLSSPDFWNGKYDLASNAIHFTQLGVLVFGFLFFLSGWVSRNQSMFGWFSLTLFSTLIINFWIFIYQNNNIETFLQTTKYGGGIMIEIVKECSDCSNKNEKIIAPLMLRTTTHFIVYDKTLDRYLELPNSQVISVSYSP